MTPQWRQLAAVQVLAELLAYKPALSWSIEPTPYGPPLLLGEPYEPCATDVERRKLIAEWSRILESPVVQERYATYTGLYVRTVLRGVHIEIATHVGLTVPALDGAR